MIHSFYLLILTAWLFWPITENLGQTMDDLLLAGGCEAFEHEPKMCQGVMVGAWSQVWTSPKYGFTQEYFQAQMNLPFIDKVSAIDAVTLLSPQCAFQYAKLVCPVFLRPCTAINNSLVPYPALPHSVCRSVCEELNTACAEYLLQNGLPPSTAAGSTPSPACPSFLLTS